MEICMKNASKAKKEEEEKKKYNGKATRITRIRKM